MVEPTPEPASSASAAPVRRRPRLSRRKRLLFIMATLAMLLVLLLAGLEVLTRVLDRFGLVHWGAWEARPGVRFKLRPGSNQGLNREGFRDLDRPFVKPDSVYRVLFLGDSYVWGTVDYKDNFPTLLEQQLNALAPARRIEIINLGVPSYGPLEAYELWKNYGTRYQPDAVIFGFFYGNDLTDDSDAGYWRTVLGERVMVRHGSLLDRFRLLLFLRAKWNFLTYRLTHPATTGEPDQTDPAMQAVFAYQLHFFDPKNQPELKPQLDYVGNVFRVMRDLAREQRTPLLVLRYPSELMVSAPMQRQVTARQGRSAVDYDFQIPCRAVGGLLDGLGLPTGDITPAIQAAQAGEQLYHGSHWNVRGNQVAAQAMLPLVHDFLTTQGMTFHGPTAK